MSPPDHRHPDWWISNRARQCEAGHKVRCCLLSQAMSWLGYDSLYDSRNQ